MKHSAQPPVYGQVAYDIAVKIASGELSPGDRFTGRSLMGSQYGVSPETIRRAMRLLADMKVTQIQPNVGSVVLSRERAVEYVEQYKTGKDLLALKSRIWDMTAQRDRLNAEIADTFRQIMDLQERFRSSDSLRTYEFTLEKNSKAVGCSITQLAFRQRTGATVVAVRRGAEVLLSPGPQMLLAAGDILVVATGLNGLSGVSELIAPHVLSEQEKDADTSGRTILRGEIE